MVQVISSRIFVFFKWFSIICESMIAFLYSVILYGFVNVGLFFFGFGDHGQACLMAAFATFLLVFVCVRDCLGGGSVLILVCMFRYALVFSAPLPFSHFLLSVCPFCDSC